MVRTCLWDPYMCLLLVVGDLQTVLKSLKLTTNHRHLSKSTCVEVLWVSLLYLLWCISRLMQHIHHCWVGFVMSDQTLACCSAAAVAADAMQCYAKKLDLMQVFLNFANQKNYDGVICWVPIHTAQAKFHCKFWQRASSTCCKTTIYCNTPSCGYCEASLSAASSTQQTSANNQQIVQDVQQVCRKSAWSFSRTVASTCSSERRRRTSAIEGRTMGSVCQQVCIKSTQWLSDAGVKVLVALMVNGAPQCDSRIGSYVDCFFQLVLASTAVTDSVSDPFPQSEFWADERKESPASQVPDMPLLGWINCRDLGLWGFTHKPHTIAHCRGTSIHNMFIYSFQLTS